MLDRKIIDVDPEKLTEYENTCVPEMSMMRMYEDYDLLDEMMYSPSEEDRRIHQKFYEAGKRVREEMNLGK